MMDSTRLRPPCREIVTHNSRWGLDQLEGLGMVGNRRPTLTPMPVRNILLRTSSKWSIQVGCLPCCPGGNRGQRTRMSMNFRHEAACNVHGFRTTTGIGSGKRATAKPCLSNVFGGRRIFAHVRRSCDDNVLIVFSPLQQRVL